MWRVTESPSPSTHLAHVTPPQHPPPRERRTKELMAAASQAVAQRRRPALATLETAIKMPGACVGVKGMSMTDAMCERVG
jgi:hypothetical protein